MKKLSTEEQSINQNLASALFLGVDGGGTKTLAVLSDAAGAPLATSQTAASNPLRVGVETAVGEIVKAVNAARDQIGKSLSDIAAAYIGLAGVRRADLRALMRERLIEELGVAPLAVVTDAEIALYGAVNGHAGLVIIAGTGSICCGRNSAGEIAAAGGWGPLAGDEGGGAGIARRALQSIAKASDGRAPETKLTRLACDYFRANSPEDLSSAIYAPTMTNDKIAGFARFVINAARDGDAVATNLLNEAAAELGLAANAVIRRLKLTDKTFQVAHVGSIFKAENLIFEPLLKKIHETAPAAYLAAPQFPPAVAAAKMAVKLIEPKPEKKSTEKPASAVKSSSPSRTRLRPSR